MTYETSRTWRPILQRILRSLTPRPKTATDNLPLGVSRDQAASLAQLVAHPTFKAYSLLLESVGEQLLKDVLSGLPHEQYLAKCGEMRMLERLIELPHVILDKVAKLEDRKDARFKSIADADAARANTFVSTPFWDGYIASR